MHADEKPRPHHTRARTTSFGDATGTIRRLSALVAIGYSQSYLATRLGMPPGNFSTLIRGHRPRIAFKTHSATCDLFVELWAHPVQGHDGERSRAIARSRKWAVPLAWDDIDDPAEVANTRGEKTNLIDEMAVELAMRGEPVRLTTAERYEAVTRLHSLRWSDNRIARNLHVTDRTVLRIRQKLGLAAFDFADIRQVDAA